MQVTVTWEGEKMRLKGVGASGQPVAMDAGTDHGGQNQGPGPPKSSSWVWPAVRPWMS